MFDVEEVQKRLVEYRKVYTIHTTVLELDGVRTVYDTHGLLVARADTAAAANLLASAARDIDSLIRSSMGMAEWVKKTAQENVELIRLVHDAENDVAKFWAHERQRGRDEFYDVLMEAIERYGDIGRQTVARIYNELPKLEIVPHLKNVIADNHALSLTLAGERERVKNLQAQLEELQVRFDMAEAASNGVRYE